MIGKITKGGNFRGLFDYLLNPSKRPIILTEAQQCTGTTAIELTAEFEQIANLRPTTKLPVRHISLSFAPEDGEISPTIAAEIANRVMAAMGYGSCQYIAIAHHRDDPGHDWIHQNDHIHCVANAIDTSGNRVRDAYDFPRLEKTLRGIERDYQLKEINCSWERPHSNELAECSQLKNQIAGTLTDRPRLEEWIEKLKLEDIDIKFKLNWEGDLQGISFLSNGHKYSGKNAGWSWHSIKGNLTPSERDAEVIYRHRWSSSRSMEQTTDPQEENKFEIALKLAQQRLGQGHRFKNNRIEIVRKETTLTVFRNRPNKTILAATFDGEQWQPNRWHIDRNDLHHLLAATSGSRNRLLLEQHLKELEKEREIERQQSTTPTPTPTHNRSR
ncbi:MAG: relaxase/mobilization nuclease domain-containing protein [Chamaesiphon sp. CSU_1_12]|nr:relaxase/mobilization nuclease domain-containing protein [Chamaesiphon sp. CSU_1_12]